MPDQPNQPGQRNVASQGDHNVNVTGDHTTIHIHQAPPLPPPSPRHQLRAPVSDFVGRENEITALLAALNHDGESNVAGISGISGLGGIGKTELAYVVAAHLAPQYPDAQLVVDMRGTDAVPRASADALAECVRAFAGLEARLPDDEAALVRLYRECLTGRRVLVVLDNAAADEQVRPFLQPPGCALLITSRATLHLPGMKTRVQLDELAPAEARALLQEMVPRISIDVGDAVADQICYLCGYLPLAVRAAGGLLDVTPDLDAAVYAEELRDTRARLALRYANAEGHNLSVEASFQLSYQRLPEGLACVFRALAVFPADFDGAAVEAIAADAGRLQLRELLRRNLVRYRTDGQRYRLHDLARVFADAQANEAERTAWQAGHANYFCKLLWKIDELYKTGGADVTASLKLYDNESDNIVEGQVWVANNAPFNERASQLCLIYPSLGTSVYKLRRQPRERIGWYDAQLSVARKLGQREVEAVALCHLGLAYADGEDAKMAIEFHKQHLDITRELHDLKGEGAALVNLGYAYFILREMPTAIEYYEQYLARLNEVGDLRGEGAALGNLGLAHFSIEDSQTAQAYFERQLVIVRKFGDKLGECNALSGLGVTSADLGNIFEAIEFYEQALSIRREIGHLMGQITDLLNLAEAWEQVGNRAKASDYARSALTICEDTEDSRAATVRAALAEWRQ